MPSSRRKVHLNYAETHLVQNASGVFEAARSRSSEREELDIEDPQPSGNESNVGSPSGSPSPTPNPPPGALKPASGGGRISDASGNGSGSRKGSFISRLAQRRGSSFASVLGLRNQQQTGSNMLSSKERRNWSLFMTQDALKDARDRRNTHNKLVIDGMVLPMKRYATATYSSLSLLTIVLVLFMDNADRYPFIAPNPCFPCECDRDMVIQNCNLAKEVEAVRQGAQPVASKKATFSARLLNMKDTTTHHPQPSPHVVPGAQALQQGHHRHRRRRIRRFVYGARALVAQQLDFDHRADAAARFGQHKDHLLGERGFEKQSDNRARDRN